MDSIERSTVSTEFVREQLQNIASLCENYGLYGKLVDYTDGYSVLGQGVYVVISDTPILDNVNPYELALRNERNNQAVYPKDFAIRLSSDNYLVAYDAILKFCEKSEFLRTLFKEFDATLPTCIRQSEYIGLKNFNDGRYDTDMGGAYQIKCHEGLVNFFKKEKKKNKLFQENRAFFRSDKFDETAGRLQQISDFNNRHEPLVRLSVLMQYTDKVNKLEIPEELYEPFLNYLKKCYPEVTIAVNEKKVVDSGLIELSHKLPSNHPAMKQKPITAKEYYDIIDKDFKTEGYDCIKDYQPARWEYRYVFYKAVDEPQVIAAFNDLCFSFAKPTSYLTLRERGPCCIVDLSAEEMYEFVALAKNKALLFHIDYTGKFALPSLENIHIVFNKKDEAVIKEVLDAMASKNARQSHLLYEQQLMHAPTLDHQILLGKDVLSKQLGLETRNEDRYETNRLGR